MSQTFPGGPLFRVFEQFPHQKALAFEGLEWSFESLGKEIGKTRAVLRGLGLRPGHRLLVQLKNHPHWIFLKLAAALEGLSFVAVSYRLTHHELAHHLRLARPNHLILDSGDFGADFAPLTSQQEFAAQLAEAEDLGLVPLEGSSPQSLLFTGGTTGIPKAVIRSAGGESGRVQMMAEALGLSQTDHHHLFAPLYHSGPNLFLSLALFSGACTHLYPRFREKDLITAISKTGNAVTFGVPTHYRRLLAALTPGTDFSEFAKAMRLAVCAGAPLGSEEAKRLEVAIGHEKLWEFYGSTETGTVSLLSPSQRKIAPGSVGTAPPGTEIKILDSEGRELGPGQEGLVYVKNNSLMVGYFEDPEATEACRQGEFLTVGDIGYLDHQGFLFLCDRRSDLILSGGVNVYPAEIEAVLQQFPGVALAAVLGKKDPILGECPIGFVLWEQDENPEGLLAFAKERLARHKWPRELHALKEMPMSPVGKVERRLVLAQWHKETRKNT